MNQELRQKHKYVNYVKRLFLGGKQRKPHASNLLIVTSPREPKEVGNNADAKEKECLGKQYEVQTVSQGQHLWKYHIAYRIQRHSTSIIL